MKILKSLTAEAWLTGALALVAILGFVFMSDLVAEPKALFGRSLSAIPPSLFPALVLGFLAVLACALLFTLRRELTSETSHTFEEGAFLRVVLLFGVMVFYALAMHRIGFFFASFLSMTAFAFLAGNRSLPQVIAVSLVSPIALYIVATRGLAVALPELSAIEFLYARVFNG